MTFLTVYCNTQQKKMSKTKQFQTINPHPYTSLLEALDDQVRRSEDPVPLLQYIVWYIIGAKGLGKSTLLLNMLIKKNSPFRKLFTCIFLCSPTAKRDPKFKPLVKELEEDGTFYDHLDEQVAAEIESRLQQINEEFVPTKKYPKSFNCVIWDDCLYSLPNSQVKNSVINRILTTTRHLRSCVFILSQKYNALNTICRNQVDLFSFFKPGSNAEEKSIVEDHKKDERFEALLDWATEPEKKGVPSFLHISKFSGKPIYFKNFDRINYP
jgi:hypothetical protein